MDNNQLQEAARAELQRRQMAAAAQAELDRRSQAAATAQPQQTPNRLGGGPLETADAYVRGFADLATLGYADEIAAGFNSGFGYLGDYDKALTKERGIDAFDEQHNKTARIAGQITGGVAGGVGLAKSGITLAGKAVTPLGSVVGAGVEGAAYGGLYGSGSGEDVEGRLKGAIKGAAFGAAGGAAVQKIGNAVAKAAASRGAKAVAPAVEELAKQTDDLYRASREAGVVISEEGATQLANKMRVSAGRVNSTLRPNTAGIVDDLQDVAGRELSLEALDELRQVVGKSIKRAQPQDVQKLKIMKDVIDEFSDNLNPSQITGNAAGVKILKQARQLNTRKAKTKIIERILDKAEVDATGQFTQSGMANTIRREMKTLYNKIQDKKVRGFSKEEVALVKQMASAKTSGAATRLLAKFAPRGVVSFGVGQGVGSMIPGGNIIIPGVGHFAAKSADKSMVGASRSLRDAVASGVSPIPPQAVSRSTQRLAGSSGEILAATPDMITSPTQTPAPMNRLLRAPR